MWCYQKPGFEALLLAELQRQQQRSQFCDTLLKAGGVSVPAHSCILSAISPHISSVLSSSPVPPAGQSRHVEFQTLGGCTLLHIIRLLYSGEMAGEGESEKQQAICAAAKLGIGGLVEVEKSQARGGGVTGGQFAEVGVQTEGNDSGHRRWRREVKDGSTYLWKETPSDGGKDIWTQTEEMEVNLPPPAPPAASFETIDMGAFQSLGQTDSHQFVPITIVYPPDENQALLVQSEAPVCVQEAAACGPAPPPLSHCFRLTETPSGWVDPQGAGGNEVWEAGRIEQFEGNIAGYINYFLNPTEAEGAPGGRGAGRRRAGRRPRGPRGPRGCGTGQQRAGRPRGRTAGRGRRGFTQRVDVQEVGVGRLQKQFLNRWGTRTPRSGQGGGTVGRKLFLKEREVPPAARRAPSRRGRGKGTEVSQSRDTVLGGNTERENTPTQLHQASLAGSREQCLRAKSTPVPAPLKQIHSSPPLSAYRSSLSDPLHTPTASCSSTAMSDLLTARLPPQENQPEHIDPILEEVIKRLDILQQSDGNGSPNSESKLPGSSGSGSPGSTQNKLPVSEVPVLQQPYEGEIPEMLENLFQSLEQQVDSCDARENETGDGSSSEAGQPHTSPSKSKRDETPTETSLPDKKAPRPTNRPEMFEPQREGSEVTDRAVSSEHAGKTEKAQAKRTKRKKLNYLLSLEKKMTTKKSVSSGDRKVTREAEPERNGLHSEQNCLQEKKTKTRASAVKSSRNGTSGSNHQNWKRDSYPIRSRFRQEHILDTTAFLEVPLPAGRSEGPRRARPRTKGELVSSSNGESSAARPHPQPADSCCADGQSEANQNRNEADLRVQTPEEAEGPTGSGQKRSNEDPSEEAAVKKRICFDQRETAKSAELVSSTDQEEGMDAGAVSQTVGLRSCFQGAKQNDEEILEESSTGKEEEDGDDDVEENNHLSGLKKQTNPVQNGDCDEDLDEDVDVIGGSSPAPDLVRPVQGVPLVAEEEEEVEEEDVSDLEVDVVGER